MTGWIKLHRKIEDNIVFQRKPEAMFVFMRLLLKAAHEPTSTWWKGPVQIERGQIMISVRELSALTGYTIKVVRNSLEILGQSNIIAVGKQKANGPAIITICNYDVYQQIPESEGKQTGNQRANGRAKQEKKEEVKKKEIKDMFDDRFAEFWDAFADKRGRPQAEAAWKEAIKRSPPDEIIDGAKRYRSWMKAQGDRAPTPKMAQGWLNDCRWQDELKVNGSPVGQPIQQQLNGLSDEDAYALVRRQMGAH